MLGDSRRIIDGRSVLTLDKVPRGVRVSVITLNDSAQHLVRGLLLLLITMRPLIACESASRRYIYII